MARLTKYNTNIEPYLEEIEKDIADGMTETSLAAKYNVSYDMWARYKEEWSAFSDAIKRGNRRLDKAVENALAKSAKGYFVEEVDQVFDGKGTLVSEKKKRYIPPSQTAQVFWLKNRCKDTWKDRSVLDVEEGVSLPKIEVVVKDLGDGGALDTTSSDGAVVSIYKLL